MEYHIEMQDDTATVQFQGDITFSENNVFRNMLKAVSNANISVWVFDLSDVGMIDSSGLGMFLIAKETADIDGCHLRISGARGQVANMLKLTKLSDLLAG